MKVRVRTRPVWPYALLAAAIVLLAALLLRGCDGEGAIDVELAGMRVARADAGQGSMFIPDCGPAAAQPESGGAAGEMIRVYDHRRDQVLLMELEQYIYCVTASEMPASSAPEALKAQAVAARTYTCAKLIEGGCGRGGADICTDSGHCQAYHAETELLEGWGSRADEYSARVRDAVSDTRGMVITYGGQPINALFHASSGGHTEDVENVYSQALPYLRGVVSPGEEQYSGYSSSREFSRKEFIRRAAQLGCALDESLLSAQVAVESRTEAGQAAIVRMGDGAATGRQVRKAFGLRAQTFDISFTADGGIRFDVRGYGHGVGMSQCGADAMADAGSSWQEILLHYYTGVELTDMDALSWRSAWC